MGTAPLLTAITSKGSIQGDANICLVVYILFYRMHLLQACIPFMTKYHPAAPHKSFILNR